MANQRKQGSPTVRGILIFLVVLCIVIVLAFVFYRPGNQEASPSPESPSPSPSESPSATSSEMVITLPPSDEPLPSLTPTPPPSPTPTPEGGDPDDGLAMFDKAAFMGNSCVDSLFLSGLVSNAQFYTKTGLTVKTVFSDSTPTGSVPVIDELKGKDFDKVFLLFGENELGWTNTQAFTDRYGQVIDKVREYLPNAQIYVQSIFPVSASAHLKNKYGVNNDRIREYNALLEQLAKDKEVHFIDLFSQMQNEQGVLPDDWSSDGIHPNKTACQAWVNILKDALKGE